jgi:hypothetical protein
MTIRAACSQCGAMILAGTATRTGGMCMPCKRGTRQSIDESRRRSRERRATLERLAANPRLRPWLPDRAQGRTKLSAPAPVAPSVLTCVPFEGLLPFRFGMTPDEVASLACTAPRRDLSYDLERPNDLFGNLRVGYRPDLSAVEFSVWPDSGLTVIFEGEAILGPAATINPLSAFLRVDHSPQEDVGFVIFRTLGVAVTGYHDDDPGQQAIHCGARGVWDEYSARAKPIDLSAYIRRNRKA